MSTSTRKTNEELLEAYKLKVQIIKDRLKKKEASQAKKDKREFDHQKYILAGSILKVLDLNENANADTIKEVLPYLVGLLNKKKDYINNQSYKESGDRILSDWSKE